MIALQDDVGFMQFHHEMWAHFFAPDDSIEAARAAFLKDRINVDQFEQRLEAILRRCPEAA